MLLLRLSSQIRLCAYQDTWSELCACLNLSEPLPARILERIPIVDRIAYEEAICAPVRDWPQRTEVIVPRRVEDRQVHLFALVELVAAPLVEHGGLVQGGKLLLRPCQND